MKDYVVLAFEVALLSSVAAVALWTAVALMRQKRAVTTENARRRQQWIADCRRARQRGTAPPFPPNVLGVGR